MPFSSIDESTKKEYIYIGNEKIPFKERHPEYKRILIKEFLDA